MGRRVCLLTWLAFTIVFYVLSFDKGRPVNHCFAEDALRAACRSVREAMSSLLDVHEPRSPFERNALEPLGMKFKQLEELSGLQPTERHRITDMHHIDLCGILAGKRVTMVGGEHIYHLHHLLLQHRERAEKKTFPCPYHEFCTHHHICLPPHVRDHSPPQRYIKSPTMQELVETESSTINYIVSDTLLSVPNESYWAYAFPFVDPTTGVRLRETYWLAAARKANVVILGRGPISAPGPTYAGNWSFLRHIPDYVDRSRITVTSEHKNRDDVSTHQMDPLSLDVLNAAVHLTVSRFLPDLFQFLRSLQREARPSKRRRWIWPSSWYRLPGRGTARALLIRPRARDMIQWTTYCDGRFRPSAERVLALQLFTLINADVTSTAHLEDPWTLFFNAQVYLQNMVLRELLPRYGIIFLPLDIPWVEVTGANTRGNGDSRGVVDVDLERTMAIGNAFLTGLEYILRYLE